MKLSALEQRILNFAREQFGEHLTGFLLAGLKEETAAQRWHFIITYADSSGAKLLQQVEAITYEPLDGSTYLPRRRDPLVLIALLHHLLRDNHVSQGSIRYEHQYILSLLGWKNTPKARREMDMAVERYSLLMYTWKMNKNVLARTGLSFYKSRESLISKYEIIDKDAGESGRIVFNIHFVSQLLRKSLFGIDWNSVQSISHQSTLIE